MRGDLTSGANPNTDRPNHASTKPTNSFHERYGSDAEFRRQVDEGRRRKAQERGLADLQSSLDVAAGKRPKLY